MIHNIWLTHIMLFLSSFHPVPLFSALTPYRYIEVLCSAKLQVSAIALQGLQRSSVTLFFPFIYGPWFLCKRNKKKGESRNVTQSEWKLQMFLFYLLAQRAKFSGTELVFENGRWNSIELWKNFPSEGSFADGNHRLGRELWFCSWWFVRDGLPLVSISIVEKQ